MLSHNCFLPCQREQFNKHGQENIALIFYGRSIKKIGNVGCTFNIKSFFQSKFIDCIVFKMSNYFLNCIIWNKTLLLMKDNGHKGRPIVSINLISNVN